MIFQSYPYAYLLFYIDSCILLFIWYFYVYFNAASWQSWLYYLMVVNISLSLSYNLLSQFSQALNISYYQFFTFINNIIMVIWIGFFLHNYFLWINSRGYGSWRTGPIIFLKGCIVLSCQEQWMRLLLLIVLQHLILLTKHSLPPGSRCHPF